MNWPKIHDQDSNMQKLYELVCTNRFFNNPKYPNGDREYPRIDVLKNGKYVIHEIGPRLSQSAWNKERYIKNTTDRSGWSTPPKGASNHMLDGNYVAFSTWFRGNYGHTMHDFMPYLSWLKSEFSDYKFILHDNSVTKNLIHFIDQEFFRKVFWLPQNQIVEVTGNLIVSTPDHHPCIMEKKLMSYLIDWYQKQFPVNPKLKNIIYYDRSIGSNHGREVNQQCQNDIINIIKNYISHNNLPDELIIFKGNKPSGEPLSVKDQFDIFRKAHTIIGPHGTGLTNILWCDFFNEIPIKLIEFIPGDVGYSSQVQSPFNGYHNVLSGLPLDYHCIIYEPQSTQYETFINVENLKSALKVQQYIEIES